MFSDSMFSQASRTFHSILADLNNTIDWMVSTYPVISKSSSPFINPLVTVSRAPIIIVINITFMFHSFFTSLARSKYQYFFSLSLSFTLWSAGTANLQSYKFSFLSFFIKSDRLVEMRWSVCLAKSHRILCISFSRTDSGLCIYHLFVWSNLNFMHNSQWINLPTQSCLVLNSFCANLPHSLIIYSLRVFHISFSWLFFTGVWVTASLLKFPGLFSVF